MTLTWTRRAASAWCIAHARTHARARAPTKQVQIAEYAMDPHMLAKYKAAVKAVHAKRTAKENLAEAEKKRRRAAFEAEMADLDVQDATLESSQSYEDEPAEEEKEEPKEENPALAEAKAAAESAAASAAESTAAAESSRLMQAAAGVARVAVGVAERSGLI